MSTALRQHFAYECLHIQKKSLSLKDYKIKMGDFDKLTEGRTSEEVEDMVLTF